MQLRLRIAHRPPENFGNLLMLVALHVVQKKYRAIPSRQSLYAPLQIDAVKRSFQNLVHTTRINRWRTTHFIRIQRLIQ
jgi:hypothetical protein